MDKEIIKKIIGEKGAPGDVIDLTIKVFDNINERLRYLYDRDHQIGHAYFLDVKSLNDLRRVFLDQIILSFPVINLPTPSF